MKTDGYSVDWKRVGIFIAFAFGIAWLVALVTFFFALQHNFLMLAGFRFGLYIFLTFIPLSVAMLVAYLWIRRLMPLIVAHWRMDRSNVLFLFQVG